MGVKLRGGVVVIVGGVAFVAVVVGGDVGYGDVGVDAIGVVVGDVVGV